MAFPTSARHSTISKSFLSLKRLYKTETKSPGFEVTCLAFNSGPYQQDTVTQPHCKRPRRIIVVFDSRKVLSAWHVVHAQQTTAVALAVASGDPHRFSSKTEISLERVPVLVCQCVSDFPDSREEPMAAEGSGKGRLEEEQATAEPLLERKRALKGMAGSMKTSVPTD